MTAPGYVFLTFDIEVAEKMQAYSAAAGPTLAPYGGEFIVRGGRHESLEGVLPRGRTAILCFPSYEQAKAWYESDAYAASLALRLEASNGEVFLIEGIDIDPCNRGRRGQPETLINRPLALRTALPSTMRVNSSFMKPPVSVRR